MTKTKLVSNREELPHPDKEHMVKFPAIIMQLEWKTSFQDRSHTRPQEVSINLRKLKSYQVFFYHNTVRLEINYKKK